MNWWERLYKGKARKYLLIAILTTVLPVGTAVTVGNAVDQGIEEISEET